MGPTGAPTWGPKYLVLRPPSGAPLTAQWGSLQGAMPKAKNFFPEELFKPNAFFIECN